MTKSQRMRLSAVMISSTMPSAKYSCSGSPDRFWNGNTAIDGLSGSGSTASETPTRALRALPSPACGGGVREGALWTDPVDPYRPGDVFDLLLPQILKGKRQPVADLVMDRVGDEDPARIGQRFQPRRNVNTVAVEVVVFDDHVAEIDADTELDAGLCPNTRVPLGHGLLHLDRATHRVDDAGKFHQQPVAGGLDDAAMVLGDLRIGELAAQCFEADERALLVRSHQPRIARRIGGEDRRETARLGHAGSPIARRRPDRYSSRCWGSRKGSG